ncbi:MAG: hypothetical protein EZS28_035900 [Streblomastix strix]|uniref:Uncharacterized protein n=1 Tax=Streblomastix strix TaxID=222440 RepID=A0A5J4UEE1_9EUKA|nr:MAG: hypothetical protein EZS28_035900 [Streblomastix strix]
MVIRKSYRNEQSQILKQGTGISYGTSGSSYILSALTQRASSNIASSHYYMKFYVMTFSPATLKQVLDLTSKQIDFNPFSDLIVDATDNGTKTEF